MDTHILDVQHLRVAGIVGARDYQVLKAAEDTAIRQRIMASWVGEGVILFGLGSMIVLDHCEPVGRYRNTRLDRYQRNRPRAISCRRPSTTRRAK